MRLHSQSTAIKVFISPHAPSEGVRKPKILSTFSGLVTNLWTSKAKLNIRKDTNMFSHRIYVLSRFSRRDGHVNWFPMCFLDLVGRSNYRFWTYLFHCERRTHQTRQNKDSLRDSITLKLSKNLQNHNRCSEVELNYGSSAYQYLSSAHNRERR